MSDALKARRSNTNMNVEFINHDIWPQLTRAVRGSSRRCAVAVAYFGSGAILGAYAASYILAGGCRQNPLEVIANDLQAHFDSNVRPGNFEVVFRQQCDEKIQPMLEHVVKGDVQS